PWIHIYSVPERLTPSRRMGSFEPFKIVLPDTCSPWMEGAAKVVAESGSINASSTTLSMTQIDKTRRYIFSPLQLVPIGEAELISYKYRCRALGSLAAQNSYEQSVASASHETVTESVTSFVTCGQRLELAGRLCRGQ